MIEREPTADERAGMDWWNDLDETQRAYWLWASQSAEVWQAWQAFKRYQVVRALSGERKRKL